ncbi:MAG: histidine kinase [Clostridiales bacterium]|nr:histidine kinase [Clostridiales bacterium]
MKRHTIRSSLFLTYSIIILMSFVAFTVYFVYSEAQNVSKQTFAALRQNAQNVAATIDGELQQMNMVSMNVSYSNLVKDTFYKYLSGKQAQDTMSTFENAKMLGELLTSILGPNRPVDQINLYALDQGAVASGLCNEVRDDRAQDQPWYQALQDSEFNKTVCYTGEDAHISRYYTDPNGKRFISLVRKYYDVFNLPQGYVEIQKSMRKVLAAAINSGSVYGETVIVLDQSGVPMWPLDAGWDTELAHVKRTGYPEDFQEFQTDGKADSVFSLCVPSEQSGFITILFIHRSEVFLPVIKYLRGIVLPVLLTLCFALVIGFFAAKRITDPISALSHEVRQYDLGAQVKERKPVTNIIEIAALHDGFLHMQAKIESSMQKQLLAQQQEMQSRMLALQSQMNPHFLYNSLSAIQSMAEGDMKEEIVAMCQAMARILRYISSDTGISVRLEDELKCTEDFLRCMTLRYQGDLCFSVNVPDDLMNVQVPKLCLQLLVENSVKFVTQNKPPWHVRITGSHTTDRYEITVRDNGPGFTDDTLREINENIRIINVVGLMPSLSIGGMGLLNICMRNRLLNAQNVIFIVGNNADGGACVTIGGPYHGG